METLLRYLCPEQSLTSGVVLSKGTLEAYCNPYLYLWFDLTHGWLDLTVPSKRKAWPVGWLLPMLDCGFSVSQRPMARQLPSFGWVFCIPAFHGLSAPQTWLWIFCIPAFCGLWASQICSARPGLLIHFISDMFISYVYKSAIIHLFTLSEHDPDKGDHPPRTSHRTTCTSSQTINNCYHNETDSRRATRHLPSGSCKSSPTGKEVGKAWVQIFNGHCNTQIRIEQKLR